MDISRKGPRCGPVQQPGAFVVVDIGPGIDMGSCHPHQLFFADQSADVTVRIVETAEYPGFGSAGYHTGGFLHHGQTVAAKIDVCILERIKESIC